MICYVKYLTLFLIFAQTNARIITATFIIQVIDKSPFVAVLKKYADKTYPSGEVGMSFFNYLPVTPGHI